MNNFDTVFATIKKHCHADAGIYDTECFNKLQQELEDLPTVDSIYPYLTFLQSIGLIKFSEVERSIALTEKGKATMQLF